MAWVTDLSANRFNNTYFRDAHGTGFAVDMSGDLVVRGKVGIGETAPSNQLHIVGDDGLRIHKTNILGLDTSASHSEAVINLGVNVYAPQIHGWRHQGGYTDSMSMQFHTPIAGANDSQVHHVMTIGGGSIHGNVGIGTMSPHAPLTVMSHGGMMSGAARNIFRWDYDIGRNTDSYFGPMSIYCIDSLVAGGYIVSHAGTLGASDVRIKNNITDVQDDSALVMLRALNPKTYGYKDVINRSSETVYGFIAQEVGEVIPQSVQKTQDSIPNIYQLATVGDDHKTLCFYQGFDTQDLDASSNTLKILDKETNEHFVNIEEIIDAGYIRVDTDLSDMMGDVDDSGNIVEGNKVFVYGQRVDDFHFLKKDAIWTVATAALQEVDRQLQAEKAKVATLESQLADVLTRLTALENA